MTVLQLRKEDFPLALKFALQTSQLDTMCPATLFRLSDCYSFEKHYVSALVYHEHAVALLPVPERAPHLAKLARLMEQADDEKANVFRNDIRSAFPLEVIVRIMEYGLSFDPLFVLRQSWVSRRWRNVPNHSCPELWRSWTIDHAELKGKHWESRRLAWKERSGSNISAVTLRGFTKEAVYKVRPTLRQGLRATKKLDIEVRNPAVLSEFYFYGVNDAAI